MKRLLTIALPFLAGVAHQAHAVPCSDLTTGIFADAGFTTSASTACYDGVGDNDPFGGGSLTVGGTTYESIAKLGDGAGSGVNSGGATVTATGTSPAATSGTWAITDPGTYTAFVIVLKDGGTGADNAGPKWSAYVVNYPTYSSGWWRYGVNSNGQYKQISHISFYGLEGTTTVPEPGTLALLGAGLLGLGLVRRLRTA